jgi:glycosyltransferase involved in cell wall biosynthesis
MPAYRAARYVSAAVQSILAQTVAGFELIIVYDPSDDGTEEILSDFVQLDPRIRLIENKGKKQLAAVLNVGLAAARGAFIARMDADDIALPDRFERQLAFLIDHPHIILCGTGAEVIDANGIVIAHFRPPEGPQRVAIVAEYAPPLFHPTWMMRREILDVLGGYREMSHSEDYDFQLRALDAGLLLDNCPAIGIRYRRDPEHRARTISHKAGNYAYRMHKLRQAGRPDGFNPEELRQATAPAGWPMVERLGLRFLQSGFSMADNRSPLAPVVMTAGLLFLPASARLAMRKIVSTIRLWLYDWRARRSCLFARIK